MNRLKDETSPYLLQHADNPVDWYPWGAEALARAQAEDKPLLISIGYSACHWCHVMAHESFEHEPTAQFMNEHFINIKVDREERPDLDDIYMQAVQSMTRGHGGWPMTVFCLPDGRPFYGGTYFPREPRYGMPSFMQVMSGVLDAFRSRRADVEKAASSLTDSLQRDRLGIGGDSDGFTDALFKEALAQFKQNYDAQHGGFSSAPKFPNPMNLEFILRIAKDAGDTEALDMLTFTLTKMARGGIYDQIGGGFHRYSVDAIWLVPHFEKMLYDNAQLSRVYLHAYQATGSTFFRDIAVEIYDYLLREMASPEGGFYSATDADSEGEEGRFFVWTKDELYALLGDDTRIALEYFGVTSRGNFEGRNILHVPNEDDVVAERLGIEVETLHARLIAIKDRLYAARSLREHPLLDDKVLAAWNGLTLASLAEAGRVLDRADYTAAAVRCASFIIDHMLTPEGRLLRTYKNGVARIDAYLEDYANVIDGLLELYQTTFDPRWFIEAQLLAQVVLAGFRADDGGFFDTSGKHETLIARPRSLEDNATPSGNSMFAKDLIRLAAFTGDADYDETARETLGLLVNAMRAYPQAFGEALNAAYLLARGVDEVALVGDPTDATTKALLAELRQPYRPAIIVAHSPVDVPDESHPIPLLNYRTMLRGQPTVYVCRRLVCKLPVMNVADLRALLV